MNADVIFVLACMGGLSLYLVIATAVGKVLYGRMKKDMDEEGKLTIAIMGGVFFPITIPLAILILWISAMINIPMSDNEEGSNKKSNGNKSTAENEFKEMNNKVKTKFEVGDLVTGIKGNPGKYSKLYEGCVCRVLEVDDEDEDMEIKLVDHIDKEAHLKDIGMTSVVPYENFVKIQPKRPVANKVSTTVKKKK